MLDVLQELGFDPEDVLARGGFDPALFEDPDNLLPYQARSRLLSHCVATTGCRHFGLLVGQQDGLHSLGLLGLLVKYSPDVGTALDNLVRYFHLNVRGASIALERANDIALLSYQIHESGSDAEDQVGDGAVAATYNILRELCGPDWKPTEVWFLHRKPISIEPWERFFKSYLRFDAEQNAVIFHASWLRRQLPDVHRDVRLAVQKQVDLLAIRHRNNFPEQVRTLLRATLVSGQANAEHIAALFSMHPRTMARRLKVFGIGFQDLLDETRYELARQLLHDSSVSINQIALILQYADSRAFIRAFRRWSGTTPARWRSMSLERQALS
mgnify:CR=1 FL=1